MGATFLAAAVVLGVGIFGMCIAIIFKKNGHFPHYDVGSNEEMRKRGIRCYKDEDAALHGKKYCKGNDTEACKECSFYNTET